VYNNQQEATDNYNAGISVNLWSNDEEANETASEISNAIMEAIREVVESFPEREGVGLTVTISETQSMFQPRQKEYSLEVQQELITGELEGDEDRPIDPRQMQFPFE
jgi:hypothetical protein